MDRVLASEAKGRGFDPRQPRHPIKAVGSNGFSVSGSGPIWPGIDRPPRMSQFSFDFDPPRPPAAPAMPTATVVEPSLEQMAQRLDAHPDYRVLRRLVPVLDLSLIHI